MLRLEHLLSVYRNLPASVGDIGSLKVIVSLSPDFDQITSMMLVEAERFWAATLMQLLASRVLEKAWLHTWGDVAFYYADFFLMNSILRLAGRSITFSEAHHSIFRIARTDVSDKNYDISKVSRGDHRVQWDFYYDLVKNDITDDPLLRELFNVQLEFKHQESWFRQWINYDLEYGYDERHYASAALDDRANLMASLLPYNDPLSSLSDDSYSEIAKIIYIWKYLKFLFRGIADKTNFANYFYMQSSKLRKYVENAPFDNEIKGWVLAELE